MKSYIVAILTISFCIAGAQVAEPDSAGDESRREELRKRAAISNAAQPKGYIFQPSKSYPPDKKVSVVLKNCSMTEFGPLLASLTGKEVLVSSRTQHRLIPELIIDDYPDKVKDTVIARIKESGIRIGDLFPYSLVCFDCPEPMLESTLKLK